MAREIYKRVILKQGINSYAYKLQNKRLSSHVLEGSDWRSDPEQTAGLPAALSLPEEMGFLVFFKTLFLPRTRDDFICRSEVLGASGVSVVSRDAARCSVMATAVPR